MRRLPLVLVLCALAVAQEVHGQTAAADFLGDWVPASADCAGSKLRLRVGETQMTLMNGKDEAAFGNVAWPTTYFGPDYQGISAVAIPDGDSGNQLFSVYFNADEKKGVTKLVFEEGVERPEPQFAPYNEIFRKAKALKARFPLTDELKRCAASTPAAAPPAPSSTER
jgi:hypothetical protein